MLPRPSRAAFWGTKGTLHLGPRRPRHSGAAEPALPLPSASRGREMMRLLLWFSSVLAPLGLGGSAGLPPAAEVPLRRVVPKDTR